MPQRSSSPHLRSGCMPGSIQGIPQLYTCCCFHNKFASWSCIRQLSHNIPRMSAPHQLNSHRNLSWCPRSAWVCSSRFLTCKLCSMLQLPHKRTVYCSILTQVGSSAAHLQNYGSTGSSLLPCPRSISLLQQLPSHSCQLCILNSSARSCLHQVCKYFQCCNLLLLRMLSCKFLSQYCTYISRMEFLGSLQLSRSPGTRCRFRRQCLLLYMLLPYRTFHCRQTPHCSIHTFCLLGRTNNILLRWSTSMFPHTPQNLPGLLGMAPRIPACCL